MGLIAEIPWPHDLPRSARITESAAGRPVVFHDRVVGRIHDCFWAGLDRDRPSLMLNCQMDEEIDGWLSLDYSPRHRQILLATIIPRVRLVGAS